MEFKGFSSLFIVVSIGFILSHVFNISQLFSQSDEDVSHNVNHAANMSGLLIPPRLVLTKASVNPRMVSKMKPHILRDRSLLYVHIQILNGKILPDIFANDMMYLCILSLQQAGDCHPIKPWSSQMSKLCL